MGRDRERHTPFRSHLQALPDGILDVIQCFLLRTALAHASRNGRALHDIGTVFIPLDRHDESHESLPPASLRTTSAVGIAMPGNVRAVAEVAEGFLGEAARALALLSSRYHYSNMM